MDLGDRWRASPDAIELASIARTMAATVGRELDDGLLLASVARPSASHAATDPDLEVVDLGAHREVLYARAVRRISGAWYTPAWLARRLVHESVEHRDDTVWDPCCGGGVFLVAGLDRLVELGVAPADALRQVRGSDIDPVSAAAAQFTMWAWGLDRGVAVLPDIRVEDSLLATVPPVSVIVGNPPFLGQLRQDTVATASRRAALRERWGPAVRAYTDPAWLFLLHGAEHVVDGGRVTLVQPQSVLAARDAAGVRAAVDELATLTGCWLGSGGEFDASVDVCAPQLVRRGGAANDWTGALADKLGIPSVLPSSVGTLADLADVAGGFRDEYYGLVGAVDEAGDGPRLITSGSIDPLVVLDRPIRFAKQSWSRPTVDIARVDGKAKRWVSMQARSKLLVATQTRVLEVVVDVAGELVGGVPTLVVLPKDEDVAACWRIAALISSPVASAVLARRTVGTALSVGACKPTVATLSSLPIPSHDEEWNEGAELVEHGLGDRPAWHRFAKAMNRAYGIDDQDLIDWWLSRHPNC